MTKDKSFDEEDVDRVAEKIYHEKGSKISGEQSFNVAFADFVGGDMSEKRRNFANKVWGKYQSQGFLAAGLKRQAKRIRRPKEVVAVSKNISPMQPQPKPKYEYVATNKKLKGMRIKAAKVTFINKGKTSTRYRGKNGQFVKLANEPKGKHHPKFKVENDKQKAKA